MEEITQNYFKTNMSYW